jgi:ABC-type uncharacterized transport system substrate-binding protein
MLAAGAWLFAGICVLICDAAKASGAAALNVLSSPLFYRNRQLIVDRVAALRLPAIYSWAEEADEGGFLAYGPRDLQIFRELVAHQLVKILGGIKPADIPIEQPTNGCRDFLGAGDLMNRNLDAACARRVLQYLKLR